MWKTILIYALVGLAAMLLFQFTELQVNTEPYQFYYLGLALLIWLFGYQFAGGRFVLPKWKRPGKLIAYLFFSWLLLQWIGHYALIFIIGHQLIGIIGHVLICRKHDINWRTCQPEEKYRALMEKWARGDFS